MPQTERHQRHSLARLNHSQNRLPEAGAIDDARSKLHPIAKCDDRIE
jgi:hypothetical protein